MTPYELEQQTVSDIRTELTATPITDGTISINKIFRENDRTKPKENFYEAIGQVLRTHNSHICQDAKMIFIVNSYFKNERLAMKFASLFIERFYIFSLTDGRKVMNIEQLGGVIETSKGLYMAKLKFDVFN